MNNKGIEYRDTISQKFKTLWYRITFTENDINERIKRLWAEAITYQLWSPGEFEDIALATLKEDFINKKSNMLTQLNFSNYTYDHTLLLQKWLRDFIEEDIEVKLLINKLDTNMKAVIYKSWCYSWDDQYFFEKIWLLVGSHNIIWLPEDKYNSFKW